MKVAFLYDGPHPAHAVWAKSLDAVFVSNSLTSFKIPNLSRLLKTFSVLKDIPSNVDLLLCESGAEILTGALWKRQHPDKRLVLIVDDPKLFFLARMNPLKIRMYTWALSYYDLLIPTSDFMRECIPIGYMERSVVVPLFVEDRFRFSKPAMLESKNIVFVGRVGAEKGVDSIIRAFKVLKKDFPEARLYIVGDGPLKNRLERENRDVVFTGRLADPIKCLMKGSIYMNLARVEPFGIAILEAMCLGLVPVVTDNVGVAEVIKRINPGLVVRNEAEGAEMVRKLWNSPALHREYSDKCVRVAREFSRGKSVRKFKEAISGLL